MSSIGYNTLNLAHRADRRIYIQSNYQSMRVPYHAVKFHEAVYGLDYPDSDTICDEAVKEFPGYDQIRNYPRGDCCCSWGTLRIFRHIAASDDYPFGYYNQDDKLLMLKHQELEQIIGYLDNLPDDFLFLQMTYNAKQAMLHREPLQPITPTSQICRGIPGSGDSGLIMSKKGAQFLIDAWNKEPHGGIEVMIQRLDPQIPGAYGILDPNYAIESLNTKYFGVESWRDDQDRINVNEA